MEQDRIFIRGNKDNKIKNTDEAYTVAVSELERDFELERSPKKVNFELLFVNISKNWALNYELEVILLKLAEKKLIKTDRKWVKISF